MAQQPISSQRPVAPRQPFASEGARRYLTPRLVIWAIVVGLLIWFLIQNSEQIDVKLTFWETNIRLSFALLIAAGFGFLMGWLLPRLRR